MKKKARFIDLYYKWMEAGKLPRHGLCNSLPSMLASNEAFLLVEPTRENYKELNSQGLLHVEEGGYWGADMRPEDDFNGERAYNFNSLRQTIILFCAAINNEL